MKIVKLLLIALLIGVIIFVWSMVSKKIEEDNSAWKIEVINSFINVRSKPNQYEAKLGTIEKGKKYKVIEINLDDTKYVWYKIEYNNRGGWVASDRDKPFVKEHNNPNNEDTDSYFVEYKKPRILFFEDVYYIDNISSINYEHLEIDDDSECELSHIVYFEEFPTDSDEPQYWILYKAVDTFDNSSSVMQKIIFKEKPTLEEVELFENYKKY